MKRLQFLGADVRKFAGMVLVALLATGLLCSAAVGYSAAEVGLSTSNGTATSSAGWLGSLVEPSAERLLDAQLSLDAQLASRASPEAALDRERSRSSFANLGAGAAARLVSGTFPALVGAPPPLTLPPGARLRGYDSDYAARLETAEHKHALVISSTPIDTAGSSGARVPVNLALVASGASYRPSDSPVAARIPRKLSNGIELPDSGVTLVPTGPSGAALGSAEGTLDGDSVLFANTQQSTDTAVKPLATGFETDTVLRSVRSPQALSFRVQGPSGVSLSLRSRRDGSAAVLENGGVVASIVSPRALDAAGTNVPVAMRVVGNRITLVLDHRAGSYQYPILVDPAVIDTRAEEGRRWESEESHSAFNILFQEAHSGVLEDTDIGTGGLEAGNYGLWGYETQGESYIYEFTSETSSSASWAGMENQLAIVKPPGVIESWQNYGSNYGTTFTQLCGQPGCGTGKVEAGNETNLAYFQQVITKREFGSETFKTAMSKMAVYLLQEKVATGGFNTTLQTFSNKEEFAEPHTNVLYANTWLGPNNLSAFALGDADPGIGINQVNVKSIPAAPGWEYSLTLPCIQCKEFYSKNFLYYGEYPHALPDGEDTIEVKVANATGGGLNSVAKVKVDGAPPHELVLGGLPSNMEIGNGIYHVKMTAKDGSTVLSSGVERALMSVDGITHTGTKNSCSPGPCTVTNEWTMSGSEYAVGEHELTFKVYDYANNIATVKYKFFVARPTQPVPSGPGSVDPQTGELNLSSTDASIPGGLSDLSVSRSYGSMHLTAGSEGPLGPQWDFGIGDAQNLTKLPDGDMLLTNGLGLQAVFASKGVKEFTPPPGDLNLTLTESTVEGKVQFQLKDSSGNTTVFTASSAGEGNVWLATKREVANGLYATTTSYQIVGSTVEPTQILAPKPEGVSSCAPELVKGCRALGFVYSTKTTATGDGKSEWGEYEGRLKEITFTAWSPSAGKMTTTGVAKYEYDKEGKLRAEWDPRISPVLKTTYGYDTEGHVTVVDPPGQEPWLINYGSISGDPRTGRVLGLVRPSAATALGGTSAPVNTAAPTLSTTKPEIGGVVTVTNGTWSNSPLGYTYQWYSCTTSECKAILGATNQSYAPLASEKNATLYAEVRATNGNATVSAPTAKSLAVKVFAPRYLSQFPAGTVGGANSVASDSAGNIWVAQGALSDKIEKYSPTGEKLITVGGPGTGEGQFKRPMGIAIDSSGNLWIADYNNNRVEELSSSGTYLKQFGTEGTGNGQFKKPAGIAITKNGYIWVVDSENNRIERFESNGKYVSQTGTSGTGEGQFKTPNGIAIDPQGHLWVVDTGNNRVEELTEGGFYMAQHSVEKPLTVAIAPSGNMWITRPPYTIEEMSPTGEVITTFGSEGTGNGQFKALTDVDLAAGAENVLVSIDSTGPRVQQFTIGEWGIPAVPSTGTNALTTFEYHVPVKGTGAPYAMGWPTVGTWGEKHEPLEATAIFPPDEPQSQPAHDYRRAAIYYLDTAGHTVNVATPNGGIETTEYNASNDVVRTLSPDNRAAALKEGAKSEAVSKLLDTQSTYNTAGNELTSTLGPQHLVKLANGKEVQAREHTVYSYDESAPTEGGPYNLVTKTTRGAQVEGEAEQDVRTSTSSYSGQGNLGWKLRKPTAVTTDPSGLKLTQTAVYEPSTGNVIETKSPAGTTGGSGSELPVYSSSFGSAGSGNGQFKSPEGLALTAKGELLVADEKNSRIEVFNEKGEFVKTIGSLGTGVGQMKEPRGVAVDSKGNIWVADTANNRVDELNEKAEFVRTFGFGVTNGEAKFQICTASCSAGLGGTGAGQFKEEKGIATDQHNNLVVADTGNNRIEKFNEKGEYQATWGSSGTGNGQFKEPRGISVAPNGSIWVADMLNSRVEVFSEGGVFENSYGSVGTGNLQFKEPKAIFVDTHGKVWVSDSKNNRVQVLNEKGEYQFQFGEVGTGNGQFKETWGIERDSGGDLFVSDPENNRIQKWTMASVGGEAHDTQTVYYSAATNAKYPTCGEHAEFANLVCEVLPAAQPGTAGLPELPTTTYSKYNVWDEAETVTQAVGSTTRTTTITYDAAGRTLTSGTSSSVGTALPTVTTEYNPETGEAQKLSTTVESKTQAVSAKTNKLGAVTNYTDADGNESTFEYETEGDGRLVKVNDGKGSQTYLYDETLGAVKEVVDSAAGKFSATYDGEGNLISESYPNGMSATYTLNSVGEETKVEYVKTTHCSSGCTWFSDNEVPSIQNQIATEASTLAGQSYKYDAAGRLTEVQETPAAKGCVTRIYGYDEDTNRTSMTTREPGAEGKCAVEGGTTVSDSFDSADRLIDSGVSYETFGNITHVPAGDAGGTELTSSFYTNNELATQTQSGETISYLRDPTRRVREIVSTGKTASTAIDHYSGEGDAVAWASEGLEKWTRFIAGVGRRMAAIQRNGETPVLQVFDLRGNIVGTAALSETETKLLSTTRNTEYGVPTSESPPKYSWQGSNQLAAELPSGVMMMGARSYVPQLGRFLQADPISGGSANAYSYVFGDPINASDPGGEFAAWFKEFAESNATEIVAAAAAREQAALEEAIRARQEAEAAAAASMPEEPQEPLGGYGGWLCQDALETHQEVEGCGGGGGGGGGGKATAVAASVKFNACTGHPNPHDKAEGCCAYGKALAKWEYTPIGKPCDVQGPQRAGRGDPPYKPPYKAPECNAWCKVGEGVFERGGEKGGGGTNIGPDSPPME